MVILLFLRRLPLPSGHVQGPTLVVVVAGACALKHQSIAGRTRDKGLMGVI